MQNPLINALDQLYEVVKDKMTRSKGKKVLGLITIMAAHDRLFFGPMGEYSNGAVYRISAKSFIIYVIKHDILTSEAICFHGIWKGTEDTEWYVSKIKEGSIEVRQGYESASEIDQDLISYLIAGNVVDMIGENDSQAGYFIPIYPTV